MRHIITIILSISFLLLTNYARAVSSPTVTSEDRKSNTDIEDSINELKEKIASKVAELKLVEKRGIIGKVIDVSPTTITITDINNTNRIIDVDDITKFQDGGKNEFGISDIQKNDILSIIGIYNKQSKRLLARLISKFEIPQYVSGQVISTNKSDFTINISTSDNKEKIVDIEKYTDTKIYNGDTLLQAGFSKIEKNIKAYIVGYPSKTNKERLSANKIILLSEIKPTNLETNEQ